MKDAVAIMNENGFLSFYLGASDRRAPGITKTYFVIYGIEFPSFYSKE